MPTTLLRGFVGRQGEHWGGTTNEGGDRNVFGSEHLLWTNAWADCKVRKTRKPELQTDASGRGRKGLPLSDTPKDHLVWKQAEAGETRRRFFNTKAIIFQEMA